MAEYLELVGQNVIIKTKRNTYYGQLLAINSKTALITRCGSKQFINYTLIEPNLYSEDELVSIKKPKYLYNNLHGKIECLKQFFDSEAVQYRFDGGFVFQDGCRFESPFTADDINFIDQSKYLNLLIKFYQAS